MSMMEAEWREFRIDRSSFSKTNLVCTYADLRRALDKEPSHATAGALVLVGEDLRKLYGIDLRPYYDDGDIRDAP